MKKVIPWVLIAWFFFAGKNVVGPFDTEDRCEDIRAISKQVKTECYFIKQSNNEHEKD